MSYEKVSYVPNIDNMMAREMDANHGVTQGRHSSCNIFSFYTSAISNCIKDIQLPDFTNLFNILQLADDTLLLSEREHSLAILFEKIFTYAKQKYIIINMDKTKYMNMVANPSLHDLPIEDVRIPDVSPVNLDHGYNWLGSNLSYSSDVRCLIRNNFQKKKCNIGKFYAWLQINNNTPFPLKMKILYGCMTIIII